ncbi:MAG: exodeoxyribonuclease III [Gammaproteobacteria bacterium]
MRIVSWNLNSVRARYEHLMAYIAVGQPDVLLLQETKCVNAAFPFEELRDAGYDAVHWGQKTYNGVAIVSRLPIRDAAAGMPARPDDEQARLIAATTTIGGADMRLVCAYVPNGGSVDSEKYQYKLEWLADFAGYLGDTARDFPGGVIVGGDFNVAPTDDDMYDADDWGHDTILISACERRAFAALTEKGYVDAHRLFAQPPERAFSWWDYRAASFARNHGVRIDMFLLSPPAEERCTLCTPDPAPRGWDRPSDHAPIVAQFE